MLFNSYVFLFLFLPLTLAGWYGLNRKGYEKAAQGYLIGTSLWFYAWFNVSFLWVILGSCLFHFGLSWLLHQKDTPGLRRLCLILGVAGNVGALGIFKYYNFFVENINGLLHTDFQMKHILLPLGISFFTFQQLSFLIDRCRGEAPYCGILDYLSFVTFFPSLISGPIVLHGSTIAQFQDGRRRRFHTDTFAKGVMQFAIGLGKKVLLADTLALAVNYGYDNIPSLDAPAALAVAVGYTLELYFDFSGYTDMAVGVGKMFGITLPENFKSPYRAVSVKDFWKRWHMTLGSFLQTYIYIPLGGSRKGRLRTFLNTMITFLVSGLWHGANWTFIFWGFLHGLGVAASGLTGKKAPGRSALERSVQESNVQERNVQERKAGPPKADASRPGGRGRRILFQTATFAYVCMAFVFFRADTMGDGFALIGRIFSFEQTGQLAVLAAAMEPPEIYLVTKALSLTVPSLVPVVQTAVLFLVLAACCVTLAGKRTEEIIERKGISFRFTLALALLFAWSVISLGGVSTFVYFSF